MPTTLSTSKQRPREISGEPSSYLPFKSSLSLFKPLPSAYIQGVRQVVIPGMIQIVLLKQTCEAIEKAMHGHLCSKGKSFGGVGDQCGRWLV
jgi:hypothetical protein